jgi:hypothetical protein
MDATADKCAVSQALSIRVISKHNNWLKEIKDLQAPLDLAEAKAKIMDYLHTFLSRSFTTGHFHSLFVNTLGRFMGRFLGRFMGMLWLW